MRRPVRGWPLLATAMLASLVAGTVAQQRYRMCVVKYEENTKAVSKYCPMLKGDGSRAECVFAASRLDCLRLITKNDADFGIFQAEDALVATRYTTGDLVVTHDIRTDQRDEYEYSLVAIVRKTANIKSVSDLRDKNLCHPGHGYETDWTEIEGKFFEARVVPQQCDPDLSVRENEIKSSSEFFRAACKAGMWVPDSKFDAELKSKYSNLCKLCDSPKVCSKYDKYWGRTGPLLCLTDGYGDVAWARLDDAQQHFSLTSGQSFTYTGYLKNPDDYNFLCDDGTQQPLNTSAPCSWMDRPWPVIISQRSASVGVQKLIASLKDNSEENWQQAMQQLLGSVSLEITPLNAVRVPEDYLGSVPGFLSANSMIHCDRNVKLCTSSELDNAKCRWLSEAAKANGVVPDVICEDTQNVETCMELVGNGDADAVLVESDYLAIAKRKYGLLPILYEHSNIPGATFNLAAIVNVHSHVTTLEDLKGKKACFSVHEGVGWNTAIATLRNNGLLPEICPNEKALGSFFSEACVPGLNTSAFHQENLIAICKDAETMQKYRGEKGALECLKNGKADVAFISLSSLSNDDVSKSGPESSSNQKDFRAICSTNASKECYLSWAMRGQIMVKSDATTTKKKDIDVLFKYLNNVLGKTKKSTKPIFQIFAPFDGNKNVLFHDATDQFEDYKTLAAIDGKPFNYELIMNSTEVCSSGSPRLHANIFSIFCAAVVFKQYFF